MAVAESPKYPTYRYPLNLTTVAGESLEIQNPTGSGKALAFTQALFSIGTASDIQIRRTSSVNTGGTASNDVANLAKKRSTAPASVVTTINTFSVAPTAGTVNGHMGRVTGQANSTFQLQQDNPQAESITLQPGENLTINTSVITTVKGYIEWMEIPS